MICRKYVCDANLSDLTILHKASMDVDRNPTVNSVKANYDTKKKKGNHYEVFDEHFILLTIETCSTLI